VSLRSCFIRQSNGHVWSVHWVFIFGMTPQSALLILKPVHTHTRTLPQRCRHSHLMQIPVISQIHINQHALTLTHTYTHTHTHSHKHTHIPQHALTHTRTSHTRAHTYAPRIPIYSPALH